MNTSAALSIDNRIYIREPSTGYNHSAPFFDSPAGFVKRHCLSTGTPKEKAEEPIRDELPAISDTGEYSKELSRMQQLNYYLGSVRDAGDIDDDTAALALRTWETLSASIPKNLSVPDAAPGPEGQLLFAWNTGEHHLELEIFPNSTAELFYFNRVSNETWEDEYDENTPLSQQAKDKLNIFTWANE